MTKKKQDHSFDNCGVRGSCAFSCGTGSVVQELPDGQDNRKGSAEC